MADFPRDKQWRTSTSRLKVYRDLNPLEPIPIGLHELTHENQTYRFRYVVRVTTVNEDTNEDVIRHVSLTDDERPSISELKGMAQDLVMDSPVSASETFASADIVFALRK